MDAVREVPQLLDRRAGVLERFVDELPKLRRGVAEIVRQLQRDDGMDEPLLRAVVEVTDNASSLLIRCGDDPGAGRDQLGPGRGVRHGSGDQLSEAREPVFGAGCKRLALIRAGDQRSPDASVDDYGRPDLGADTQSPDQRRQLAGHAVIAVAAAWCGGALHNRVDRVAVKREPGRGRDVHAPNAPARHRQVEPVRGEVGEVDRSSREQPAGLLAHRVKDHLRLRTFGDQRRDPSQRCLLVDEAAQLLPGLGVRDRGCDQFCELRQATLDVPRQRGLVRRASGNGSPHTAVDDDRRADAGADPRLMRRRGNLSSTGRRNAVWPVTVKLGSDELTFWVTAAVVVEARPEGGPERR